MTRATRMGLVLAALMLAGAMFLWMLLPAMLAARWTADLRAWGYPQAELAVDHLGPGGISGAFSLGGDQGADQFSLRFSPADLWHGRIGPLHIEGLHLSLPVGPDGIRLPQGTALPITGPVTFGGARIALTSDVGLPPLIIKGDGRLDRGPDGWQGRIGGTARFGVAQAGVEAAAAWDAGRLTELNYRLTPRDEAGQSRLSGQGRLVRPDRSNWTAAIDLQAAGLGRGLPDLVLNWHDGQGTVRADWATAARLNLSVKDDGQGRHRLEGGLTITDITQFATRAGLPDPGLTGGPVLLALQADNLLSLDAIPATGPTVALRLTADGIGIGGGPRDNSLSLGLLLVRRDGGWWLAPDPVTAGSVNLPTLGVEGRGLMVAGPVITPLDLRLGVASLRTGWTAALPVDGRLHGDPAGEVRLDWTAGGVDRAVSLKGEVTLHLPDGSGRAMLELSPLRVGADGRRVESLFPGSPLPAGLSGTIAARLRAGWHEGTLDGTADLLLDQVALERPGLRLAGVNGVLRFDRLSPLSMPAQRLSVALADVGVPLRAGAVGLELPGDGVLRLTPEAFRWTDNPVTVAATTYRLGSSRLDMGIEVAGLPLADALRAVGVMGLNADGALSGRLPLRWDAAGVRLGPGRLHAGGAGRLALASPAIPVWLDPGHNDSLALVTRALNDYRYDGLELSFDGLERRLDLSGASPGLYGGYPMNMSLRLAPFRVPPPPPSAPPDDITSAIAAFKAMGE
ncbi:intermembrane phospholipid transport protein YdbH family protein [Niveispirillum fermenti]|uniref:intermembrane phospholipid transport protein YdbH family protein n=1 Tax=Niveispirillum fermenti TaxID=1233113 RepID=UPI003A86B66E